MKVLLFAALGLATAGVLFSGEERVSKDVTPTDQRVEYKGSGWLEESKESPGYYCFHSSKEAGELSVWLHDLPEELTKDHATPREYRIGVRVMEWRYKDSDGKEATITEKDLCKLYESDKLVYDASICQLHHTAMRRQLVPIQHGIAGVDPGPGMKDNYPHGAIPVSGGCIVDGVRESTWIWVCPDCEKKRQEMIAKK